MLCLQETENEIQGLGIYSHPPLVAVTSGGSEPCAAMGTTPLSQQARGQRHRILQHEPSTSSGVSSQHAEEESGCDYEDLSTRPLREVFFHGLPLLVHPIIILRVMCHKMFGNMLRRKTNYSAHNLTPPPVQLQDNESCPPRHGDGHVTQPPQEVPSGGAAAITTLGDKSDTPGAKRRRVNLHVQIATPVEEEEEHIRHIRRRTRRAGSMDKHLLRISSMRKRMGNVTMSLAIKAIGDSLMTPLDLNMSPPPKVSDLDLSDPEMKRRNIFRFPSIKKRFISKSYGYLAGLGESFESGSSEVSSAQSLGQKEETDLKEFQKELINLPIYEVDTHRMDQATSPLISRSNSVPEHLDSLQITGVDNIQALHRGSSSKKNRARREAEMAATKAAEEEVSRASDSLPRRTTEKARSGGGGGGGGAGKRNYPDKKTHHQVIQVHNSQQGSQTGSTGSTSSSSVVSPTSLTTPTSDSSQGKSKSSLREALKQSALCLTLPVPKNEPLGGRVDCPPAPLDTIIVHFAAATPCGSPSSLDQFPALIPPPAKAAPVQGMPLTPQPGLRRLLRPVPPPLTSMVDTLDLHTRPNQLLAVAAHVAQTSMPNSPILGGRRKPPGSPSAFSNHSGLSVGSDPYSPCSTSLHIPSPGREVPIHHQGVMRVVETWVHVCHLDFESCENIRSEMKDFLNKMASLGIEYKAWSHKILDRLHLEVSLIVFLRHSYIEISATYIFIHGMYVEPFFI